MVLATLVIATVAILLNTWCWGYQMGKHHAERLAASRSTLGSGDPP